MRFAFHDVYTVPLTAHSADHQAGNIGYPESETFTETQRPQDANYHDEDHAEKAFEVANTDCENISLDKLTTENRQIEQVNSVQDSILHTDASSGEWKRRNSQEQQLELGSFDAAPTFQPQGPSNDNLVSSDLSNNIVQLQKEELARTSNEKNENNYLHSLWILV